ncbi:MAG: glycosyltransferase family 4 protein [Ruminococcus sp.]|jgi:1,2-diacylglycerol 3-alpha-glucosyltransferase
MKILITTDWYEPVVNGVVTSVKTLVRELKKAGHEVRILTLSRTCQSYRKDEVFYIGSVSVGKIYPQARLKLPVSGKYMKELMKWKPDIIHSQCEFSTFFPARKIAAELGIPIIHTYHTIYEDYTHYFSPGKKWGRGIAEILTRRLSRQVCGIIVPSRKIQNILEGYQVECPLWVIPSGIDILQYKQGRTEEWREKIRARYSIAPDTKILLYVGRLAREKNVEELISYQKEARKQNAVLMLVGDGPFRKNLEDQVREEGLRDHVIFVGMVPPCDVWKYYQAGDLFVSASVSETQGMTYGEALALGLPLLCRKDECLQEVVENGRNGWQYENQKEFLKYLADWSGKSSEEKREIRRRAQKSAGQFSAERFYQRVVQVYEKKTKETGGAA